ncbi:LytTR family DNA-binding domain-containing protein [uncultured Flavobacterium sp.]|uniref:LytR/AlgR family response regulator transcription factor n=1 Tax=uncultured Flavobacterium sp. TaxID=165435 RepID=UPI0030EBF20F|tara:strand:+ start:9365 stop:10081 length:717 start_codon:yes stop_codon:yes gene_type:complete
MNCIIIDDEELARTIIEQMASKDPELLVQEKFSNAIEAIKFLNMEEQQADLIFLDIHMPGFTGFDFIKTIKDPPAVILITSDKNFAIEAFEYDCIVDYLVKPLSEDRFSKAVLKAKNKKNTEEVTSSLNGNQTDNSTEFYINIDRRLIKIVIAKINVIQAKGDYILIKTESKNYTVHSTLKKLEEKLPSSLFLKVHRTYIVNLKKIIDIEDNSILINKDVIPVSRSNRPELMKRLDML